MSFDFEFPDGFEHRGRGYDWSRGMSVNAVEAYADGERPISKWTKTAILSAIPKVYADKPDVVAAAGPLTLEGLRHVFLMCSSWHHTCKYFNETDFYTIAENVTTDDIATYLQDRQAGKSALALLAKRTRYLHAHGWQVEHAAWTDARGLHADSGRVNANRAGLSRHGKGRGGRVSAPAQRQEYQYMYKSYIGFVLNQYNTHMCFCCDMKRYKTYIGFVLRVAEKSLIAAEKFLASGFAYLLVFKSFLDF